MKKNRYIQFLFLIFLLAGCTGTSFVSPSQTPGITAMPSITPSVTVSPTHTVTSVPLPTSNVTFTVTPSATFTLTPSSTPTPVYEILRGEVNVEHVMCFYGPSKAYLYKYGLLGGNNLEILGIMEDTGYIQVRAIGGDNPCWMNLEWMDVDGDAASLQPIDPLAVALPQSPYYGPLASVSARREDNLVTITWSPLVLRAGDDSEQEPYLAETWVCRSDRLVFIPFGLFETTLTVEDQPGCSDESHASVYGVEKHGYTLPVEVPWPKAR